MNKKIKMIVFEGPDMCGKSTHIDTIVDALNKEGFKFAAYKFPVYNGFKGQEILGHLKNFDYRNQMPLESINILKNHAVRLYVNKIDSLRSMLDIAKENNLDGFVVDRFDVSQLIYDIAWINILYSVNNTILGKEISSRNMDKLLKDFYDSATERAFSTHGLFSQYFDIKYIGFVKSKLISICAACDSNRRYDKYDENEIYQNNISDLSEIFFDKLDKLNVIDSLYDEGELNGISRSIINHKKKVNPLFKFLLSKEENMEKLCKQIKSNVLAVIDTDKLYRFEAFESNLYVGDDYMSNEKIVLDLVSEYKNDVTSRIDTLIKEEILKYLHGGK